MDDPHLVGKVAITPACFSTAIQTVLEVLKAHSKLLARYKKSVHEGSIQKIYFLANVHGNHWVSKRLVSVFTYVYLVSSLYKSIRNHLETSEIGLEEFLAFFFCLQRSETQIRLLSLAGSETNWLCPNFVPTFRPIFFSTSSSIIWGPVLNHRALGSSMTKGIRLTCANLNTWWWTARVPASYLNRSSRTRPSSTRTWRNILLSPGLRLGWFHHCSWWPLKILPCFLRIIWRTTD